MKFGKGAEGPSEIKVIRVQRGGKKITSIIVGLNKYGVNLADACKLMGKKFACGCSQTMDEVHGDCI